MKNQRGVNAAATPIPALIIAGVAAGLLALTPAAALAAKGGSSGANANPKSNAGGNGASPNAGGGGLSNAGGGSSGGQAGAGGNSGGVTVLTLPSCGNEDLTPGGAACSGFYQGNLLSNAAADLSAQTAGLALIGLSNWNGEIIEPQLNLVSSVVNFATALNGMTWVGVHFGAGTNSPSPQTPGGVTAFYRFDAGVNLDAFVLNFGSVSAARLYATGPAPVPPPVSPPFTPPSGGPFDGPEPMPPAVTAIPEPGTWALMILGFGAAGAMLRRRRSLASV